ncbi:MAG: MATE family efflux transporter [Oscillospiraceae bacterium]|nr:MATE family efflux transporter [Oscillospiraceae bacterium]
MADTNSSLAKANRMGTAPVGKLLLSMAWPLMLSMLVQACYNMVDSLYVSRISQNAITAMGLAFPVQNMQIGFATGIAVGVNALLSKSLGENNRERASQAAGTGILLALMATGLFMLFGIFGARPFFEMQSDVKATVDGGAAYVAICCIGSLGIFVEILGERLLQATGKTIYTLYTQGTGAVINILLDPLFIFGWGPIPAMGIAGAGVATVIGQWIAAVLAVFFNLKCNRDITFCLKNLRFHKYTTGPILAVGIPSTVMMAIGSVMNLGMNMIFQSFQETATAVFGLYYKIQSLFFMPVFGINNATISILAFNYGARQPERMKKTLKLSVLAIACFMAAGLIVFEAVPGALMDLFNADASMRKMGISALRIVAIHFPLAAIGIGLGASFQALGNGVYSSIISLCRQLIALLPVAWLLSLSGDVNLVWWAFPIAEVVSLAVTLILFARIYRQKVLPMYE